MASDLGPRGFLLAAAPSPGAGCQRALAFLVRFLCGLSCSESRVVAVPGGGSQSGQGPRQSTSWGPCTLTVPVVAPGRRARPGNRVGPFSGTICGSGFRRKY